MRGSGLYDETWLWNGSDWTLVDTNGPARCAHAMAYDSNRSVVVLFGGADSSGRLGDTWEWNGYTWTKVHSGDPAGVLAPTGRTEPGMAFDKDRGVTVLFGGYSGVNNNDTWEWDGTSWTKRLDSGPSPRAVVGMAYDEQEHEVILFGGTDGSDGFRGYMDLRWYSLDE